MKRASSEARKSHGRAGGAAVAHEAERDSRQAFAQELLDAAPALAARAKALFEVGGEYRRSI